MARTYTDKLEYRYRSTTSTDLTAGWSEWVLLDSNATSPFSFSGVAQAIKPGVNGYEYEIRVTRSKTGHVTKISDGLTDGQPNYLATNVPVTSGGVLSMTGTYSVTGTTATVTRSKSLSNSMSLTFTGNNWNYVAIKYTTTSGGVTTTHRKAAINDNKATSVTNSAESNNTYSVDTAAIEEVSLKTIVVKLGSSQAFDLYVQYNGGSSGRLTVSAL